MAYTTIDDPSAHFQTKIYTGNGSTNALTFDGNSDMQPDWLWTKCRSDTFDPIMRDSSRGIDKRLLVHATDAEGGATGTTAFGSDGFTLDSTNTVNKNTDTYVGWAWKANGGTTSTNDASATSVGTIDSVIQANTTAGFSIVTHTGSGSAGNIAHGLGAVPEWVVTKNRSQAASWAVYHVGTGAEYYLELDTNDGRETASSVWGDTTPSSTTFRVGGANTKNNSSSNNFVSYCFTPIQGYSKFSSYKGNGSTNGPFIYTGFKPAFVLIKRSADGGSSHWHTFDSTRNEFNVVNKVLFPSTNEAEASYTGSDPQIDILSNGFKLRSSYNQVNASSGNYIFICFAEHPFVSSKGTPTTAR